MTTPNPERLEKLKKFHMVLCGAGVGSLASRGVEQLTGEYSLSIQLACIVGGVALAYFAVKRFYKPKAMMPSAHPGNSTANP